MLNLPRSHGIHGQHKYIVSGGQLKVKVMLKSNGLLDQFLLMILVDGTRLEVVIGVKKLFLDIGLVSITSGHTSGQLPATFRLNI